MTTSSAARPTVSAPRVFGWPGEPRSVGRAARAWWLATACWFTGSAAGQLLRSPAATLLPDPLANSARIDDQASLPAPMAVVLFAMVAALWASLVLPMRDGGGWARLVLTGFAVPGELVMAGQATSALVAGPLVLGGIVQAGLNAVAMCAVAGAVALMWRPAARDYFRSIPG